MSFIIYFFIFEIAIGLFLFYDGFLSSFVGRKRRMTTRDLNFVPSSKFDANQVLPNLYIGSYSAALDITTLKKLGVEAIVTLGSKFKPIYKEEKLMSVEHLIVTVHDKPDANLLTSLEAISDFIHDYLQQEKVVLIHWYEIVFFFLFLFVHYFFFLTSFFNSCVIPKSKRKIKKCNSISSLFNEIS